MDGIGEPGPAGCAPAVTDGRKRLVARSGRDARRAGRGLLTGIAALLVVAVPAVGTAYLALISFSGCLVECGDAQPARGALWLAVTTALLAVPVLVGMVAARVPLRRAWPWLAALVGAATLGIILLQRVA